jgi:assimilatory nitrate reductase catalytic subunit
MINNVTIADFDPKSFEPNFKQCAVNIYSDAVPEGIVQAEIEIAGVLDKPKKRILLNEKESIKEHIQR